MLNRVGPLMLWEGFSQIVHRSLPGAVGVMKLLRRSQGGRPRALVSLFSHKAQLLTAMHQPALAFANALAGVNIGDTVPDDAEYVRACAMMTSVASWSSRQWAVRTASVYVQNALKLSRKLGGKNLPITLIMAGKPLRRLDLGLGSPPALHIFAVTGLAPPTSAIYLHRNWACPSHICTGTGLALDHICTIGTGARATHICTGTGLVPATAALGPGSLLTTSAPPGL
jgi:hypothetical protein